MTKQSLVTMFLIIIGIFAVWYACQMYKQYQQGPQIFIEAQ